MECISKFEGAIHILCNSNVIFNAFLSHKAIIEIWPYSEGVLQFLYFQILYEIKIPSPAYKNIRINKKIFYATQMLFLMCFYLTRPPWEFGFILKVFCNIFIFIPCMRLT